MVVQRSLLPRRLLLVAVLLLSTGIVPAVTRGAPAMAALSTEPAPLATEAIAPPFPAEARPVTADSAEDLTQGDWWAAVQEDIGRSEYNVTPLAGRTGAYQAPNRAHNLRTTFTGDGITIVPRTELTPTWSLSMALEGSDTTQPCRHRQPGGLPLRRAGRPLAGVSQRRKRAAPTDHAG